MFWVDVFNRSLEWDAGSGLDDVRRECGARAFDVAALGEACATLRAAGYALVLDPAAAPPLAVSQWLAAVTLRLAAPTRCAGFELPGLRAVRTRPALPQALDTVLSTALVQLAAAGPHGVARCAGVRRAGARIATPGAAGIAAIESAFARRTGVERLLAAGFQQCPRLVAGPRAGQYCSKACSNAAFALRKSAREPAYFARKQARYRAGKRRAAARVESAFAFVD